MYGKINIDELKKDLLGFQLEYGRNISNPKITGLENATHPPNPSSQNILKESENLKAMPIKHGPKVKISSGVWS